MGKRFTATEKWSDPWHRKLPPEYKLFWDYICGTCNNAGVWSVDFERAEFDIGVRIAGEKALALFGNRIRVLNDRYWFISGFIQFQYGELSEASRPHSQVLALLKKYGVSKGYPKGIHTLKDKDKDKDQDKDKELLGGVGDFDLLWSRYPRRLGRKSAEAHFRVTVKTDRDWQDIQRALANYLSHLKASNTEEKFIKHGSTWFNNWRDWLDYQEVPNGADGSKSPVSYAALARAKRESEKAREDTAAGAVSHGFRDMPTLQTETESGDG